MIGTTEGKPLRLKDRRRIFGELEEFLKETGNRYAYRFAWDGDELVELRLEDGRRTQAPVDRRGVRTGPAKRVVL